MIPVNTVEHETEQATATEALVDVGDRIAGQPRAASIGCRAMATLARLCDRFAWPIVVVSAVLAVVSVLTAATKLGFDSDRNNLIGSQAEYNQVYLRFKEEFPQDDDIVVVLTGPTTEKNRAAVDRLALLLRQQPQLFTDVLDKVNLEFVRKRLLLFVSVRDLRVLERRVKEVSPFLRRMLGNPGLVPLFASINDEIQAFIKRAVDRALKGGGSAARVREREDAPDMVGALPILGRVVAQMGDAAKTERFKYRSPWGQMFGNGGSAAQARMEDIPREFYAGEFSDGHTYVVNLKPAHDSAGTALPAEDVLGHLDTIVKQVRHEFPDVEIGVTGEPSLEVEERNASQGDSARATILSLVGVTVLFLFAFGTLLRPGLAIFTLLVAMAMTLGFAALAIGHLNILTVTCMPMLIGLGIDFGIQVISRYDEERLHGHVPLEALTRTFCGTGMSIITAGFTTAVSFLAARFTGFQGIGELGLLSCAGLLLSLLAMMTLLPALLLLYDRRRAAQGLTSGIRPSPLQGLSRMERTLLEHPSAVIALAIIFTWICVHDAVAFSPLKMKVGFVANLEKLQSEGTPAVEWEHRLIDNRKIIPALVGADTIEQARVLQAKLEKLPTVSSVESVVPMFPTDQEKKLRIIPAIQRELSTLPPLKEPLPDVDVDALRKIMGELRGIFFLIYPEAQAAGQMDIASQVREFVFSTDRLLTRTPGTSRDVEAKRLHAYQAEFFHDLDDKLKLIKGSGAVKPLTLDDLPPVLQHQLLGRTKKILLRCLPKEDIWDEDANARFLRSLDDANLGQMATGTPRQMLESTRLLKFSYEKAGLYALAVIVVLVFLHFVSVTASLLALLPLGLGILWGLGLMAARHLSFNPANYMVLPLIIGIGVANGIYVVRRYQEEGNAEIFRVSTGRAILLSNLTAMIGFASLMVAKYQGIKSLGQIMTLGVGTCMLTSLFVLPVLLALLGRRVKI